MAREKTLHHGNNSLKIAVWNPSTRDYYTPASYDGLMSVEQETDGENEVFNADDIEYAVLGSKATKKVTFTLPQLPNHALSYLCGYNVDSNQLFVDTGQKQRFALMYLENRVDVETNEKFRRMHIFYNCILNGFPKNETETDEDKITPCEYEYECIAVNNPDIVDGNKKPVAYVVIDEDTKTKKIFDDYGKNVYKPTFAPKV